jgi:hypothetical protein
MVDVQWLYPWQWLRCRVYGYHTWIDTNADGLTDTCAICGRGPFQTDTQRYLSYWGTLAGLAVLTTALSVFLALRKRR